MASYRWNVVDVDAERIDDLPEGERVWVTTDRGEVTLGYWEEDGTGFPAWYGLDGGGIWGSIVAWKRVKTPDPYEYSRERMYA